MAEKRGRQTIAVQAVIFDASQISLSGEGRGGESMSHVLERRTDDKVMRGKLERISLGESMLVEKRS